MEKARVTGIVRLAALALPLALSFPLVAGFFGAWHPAFDSMAHFRAHLAVAVAVAALPALFLGYRKEAAMSIVLAAATFATLSHGAGLPGLGTVNAAVDPAPDGRAVYRLLQINLRFDNATPEKVLSLIGRSQPDVVTLNEVSEQWVGHLDRIAAAYPHRVLCDAESKVGAVALLSRRPFAAGETGTCSDEGDMATARIDFGAGDVTVAALHLSWPWPSSQPKQIDGLAAALSDLHGTTLLAGDLNATPWSHAVARIAEAGGLQHVSGSTPTWLYRNVPISWRQWVGLPIDHVFSKGDIAVRSVRILDDVGSDHAPLLAEFTLVDPKPREEPRSTTVLKDDRASRAWTATALDAEWAFPSPSGPPRRFRPGPRNTVSFPG
ncbi:endonuclease/exonuclease/phosphatase [Mesorhizobium sp. L-8-10]|uniref:endonuclease/exonuclease/phosphatase family protein n=1 Tax=Mesorhizobium sp. L-8-10 TaxID=2744523 RepID=UPI001925E468|nr:endonuclease/exonuclease/phosphatase family protein [Mesorhizobium sp. L-8-10]BCH33932.1 endonuclease/exonuclease/phosphatase [Mesorhizobium sp. L-8-10]